MTRIQDSLATCCRSFMLALLLAFTSVCGPAAAQEAGRAQEGLATVELSVDQTKIADRYERVEKLILRMAEFDQSSNPRRAELLKKAFAMGKQRDIQLQLEAVSRLLSQDKYKRAIDGQSQARKDLQSLLELLQSENRSDRLKDEQRRIRDYIREIERLERMQRSVQGRTEGGVETNKLEKEQESVADRAQALDEKIEEQEGTDSAADSQSDDSENQTDGNSPSDSGEGSEKKDSSADEDASDRSSDGEASDGDKAENEDKPERKNPLRPDAEDKDESEKDSNEQSADPKSGDQQDGEGSQGKPSESGDSEPQDSESSESQDSESESESSSGQPGQSGQQGQQGQQGQGGDSSDEQQPQQEQEQFPGQKRVQEAERHMREAERKLAEAKRDGAIEEQKEAARKLAEAKAELEEILRQMREEEIERTLAALEVRFRRMLEMQLRVYEDTMRVDRIPQESRDRFVEIEAGKLSFEEKRIVSEADKCLNLLREEGSSVAFPESVQQMRDDMQLVTDRLAKSEVGRLTQGIEEDIIEALEEMIEALEKAQADQEERKQNPQSQMQQGTPGDMPLVDAIAELKMLKALQIRINRRTTRYATLLDDADDPVGKASDEDLLLSIQQLAERQQRLHEITRDISLGKNK